MTKILIIGSDGMLGHLLSNFLKINSNFFIYNLSRKNHSKSENHYMCDLFDKNSLVKIIKEINPNFIINCSGILINESNESTKNAIYINAYLPHFLVEVSTSFNFKLIHISTDCVFSGKKGPYSEDSIPDANDTYGLTKSLGEINSNNHLTIRTSIIGPEIRENREGLLNWILNEKGNVSGYTKSIWSGVTTVELSKAINFSILNDLSGLWILTSNQPISKYNLLEKIINRFNLSEINLLEEDYVVTNKSMTSNRKISYIVPSYDEMIDEMFDYIKTNNHIYKYNFL